MSRIRFAGLIVFTLFAFLLLALTITSVVDTVHNRRGWPAFEMMTSFFAVFALLAATVGLWSRWTLRNIRGDNAGRMPNGFVPGSKYAVWAGRSRGRAEGSVGRSGLHTQKPLRRKERHV